MTRARGRWWFVLTSVGLACVGQPPSPPAQATSGATTTGGEATSTSEGAVSTSGEVEETTELGGSETTVAAGSSTSAVEPCELVSCPSGQECMDGQCVACTGPSSCAACRADQACQCPSRDPCCEVGICISSCDPLLQDCPMGEGCYLVEDEMWLCFPDESGSMGAYADPCEAPWECDPGLVCLISKVVPDCSAMPGCCSELCDLTNPMGDAQCMGAAGGQVCLPVYVTAPPGLENVGICAVQV